MKKFNMYLEDVMSKIQKQVQTEEAVIESVVSKFSGTKPTLELINDELKNIDVDAYTMQSIKEDLLRRFAIERKDKNMKSFMQYIEEDLKKKDESEKPKEEVDNSEDQKLSPGDLYFIGDKNDSSPRLYLVKKKVKNVATGQVSYELIDVDKYLKETDQKKKDKDIKKLPASRLSEMNVEKSKENVFDDGLKKIIKVAKTKNKRKE